MSLTYGTYLHALTAIHSGTGQAVAIIDLPVAREVATGYPFLPGSSYKGVVRALESEKREEEEIKVIFGTADDKGKAGLICMTDQKLLCLPVRSYKGTFAWVSCPLALTRMVRDLKALGATPPISEELPKFEPGKAEILTADNTTLIYTLQTRPSVYLEDLDLSATQNPTVAAIAKKLAEVLFSSADEQASFKARFALVSDEVFSFLSDTCTEVAARIALDPDTHTTSGPKGNLWYEESVPAETIFYGVSTIQTFDKNNVEKAENLLKGLNGKTIQIGGNATVGRGFCRIIVK